jgi:ATP-dependent Clp protease protease subunit
MPTTKYSIEEITKSVAEVLGANEKNSIVLAYENVLNKTDLNSIDDLLEITQFKNRTIFIEDIVEGVGLAVDSIIKMHNQYDELNNIPIEQRKPIKICINSNGGLLTESLIAIDAIRMSKTPVYTVNTGKAYSGGFLIFINGDKRFVYPNGTFLFHEGSSGMEGDAHKFRNYAEFYQNETKRMKKIILETTKFTPEFYDEHSKDDLWFFAEDAIEWGVADEIITELMI